MLKFSDAGYCIKVKCFLQFELPTNLSIDIGNSIKKVSSSFDTYSVNRSHTETESNTSLSTTTSSYSNLQIRAI